MAAGGLLFVPSGSAVSWRANGYEHDRSSDGGGDDETIALRFCYVDASNFDSIKTQLPLYAAVEVSQGKDETSAWGVLGSRKSRYSCVSVDIFCAHAGGAGEQQVNNRFPTNSSDDWWQLDRLRTPVSGGAAQEMNLLYNFQVI